MKGLKATINKILAFSLFVFSGAASAGFINSGFETGDFTGWTVGGTARDHGVAVDGTPISSAHFSFQPSHVNVHSGQYAAYGTTAAHYGEFLSLSQTVNVRPGLHTIGFYMGHATGGDYWLGTDPDDRFKIGIDFAIERHQLGIFINGVYVPFTERHPVNNFPTGSTPQDMYLFASNFIFRGPPGTANIEFRISGSGSGAAVLSIDDTFITRVPEPSSMVLLSLGLLGLAAARYGRN
ncbi:PEP-CTERM sorting domain-containing protein [Marinobacter sp. F4216]|uniref:PEP-CTERM sorting domain-containing protein n=1 Tax=Marinobacter sp. F4216 TaxID=2874281 RepID=UPI001CBE1CA1|nr:PEP-CTERM sorting domain-containing protein [Marinobacter sp. F4216]MBZ2168986.1 PEP-CTERM sorting domain-containing protein [Marinobacter sp. F4216]